MVISKNGSLEWVGILLEYSSYSLELNTGNIVSYSPGNCNNLNYNYSGRIIGRIANELTVMNNFADIVIITKEGTNLKLKKNSSLVVQENGLLKLKSVPISYIYQKISSN